MNFFLWWALLNRPVSLINGGSDNCETGSPGFSTRVLAELSSIPTRWCVHGAARGTTHQSPTSTSGDLLLSLEPHLGDRVCRHRVARHCPETLYGAGTHVWASVLTSRLGLLPLFLKASWSGGSSSGATGLVLTLPSHLVRVVVFQGRLALPHPHSKLQHSSPSADGPQMVAPLSTKHHPKIKQHSHSYCMEGVSQRCLPGDLLGFFLLCIGGLFLEQSTSVTCWEAHQPLSLICAHHSAPFSIPLLHKEILGKVSVRRELHFVFPPEFPHTEVHTCRLRGSSWPGYCSSKGGQLQCVIQFSSGPPPPFIWDQLKRLNLFLKHPLVIEIVVKRFKTLVLLICSAAPKQSGPSNSQPAWAHHHWLSFQCLTHSLNVLIIAHDILYESQVPDFHLLCHFMCPSENSL